MTALPAFRFPPEGRLPTVELRHDLPDGTWHIDWMLATDQAPESPLLTFRLVRSVHSLEPGESLAATRLTDHRHAYLEYEGEVSGGRGRVKRVSSGFVEEAAMTGEKTGTGEAGGIRLRLTLHWHGLSRPKSQKIEIFVGNVSDWAVFCARNW